MRSLRRRFRLLAWLGAAVILSGSSYRVFKMGHAGSAPADERVSVDLSILDDIEQLSQGSKSIGSHEDNLVRKRNREALQRYADMSAIAAGDFETSIGHWRAAREAYAEQARDAADQQRTRSLISGIVGVAASAHEFWQSLIPSQTAAPRVGQVTEADTPYHLAPEGTWRFDGDGSSDAWPGHALVGAMATPKATAAERTAAQPYGSQFRSDYHLGEFSFEPRESGLSYRLGEFSFAPSNPGLRYRLGAYFGAEDRGAEPGWVGPIELIVGGGYAVGLDAAVSAVTEAIEAGLTLLKEPLDNENGGWSYRNFRNKSASERAFFPEKGHIDMRGAPGGENAAGFPRNPQWFWNRLVERHPEFFSPRNLELIENRQAPEIDETWIKHFPEHRPFEHDELVHHHIDGEYIAAPTPKTFHQTFHGLLHYD
jgi:hypothetical protein